MTEPTPIQPLQSQPTVPTELIIQQRKIMKNKRADELYESEPADFFVSSPGPELRPLPRDKYDAFLEVAQQHLISMDRNAEDFVPEAAKKLVGEVLTREFGPRVSEDAGFEQMQNFLARKMLKNPQYREVLDDLFRIMDQI
ncbi:MAG: hypothetical protein HYU64_16690 [Armatimonadetes bacterium]|nr:hypothetical protein [Armatimonadota bacterium]